MNHPSFKNKLSVQEAQRDPAIAGNLVREYLCDTKKIGMLHPKCPDFLDCTVENREGVDISIIKSNLCFSEIMAEKDTVCIKE